MTVLDKFGLIFAGVALTGFVLLCCFALVTRKPRPRVLCNQPLHADVPQVKCTLEEDHTGVCCATDGYKKYWWEGVRT